MTQTRQGGEKKGKLESLKIEIGVSGERIKDTFWQNKWKRVKKKARTKYKTILARKIENGGNQSKF